MALREIVPTDLPIAIHVIRTEDEQILVTEGMSARPMTVPTGGEAFQFAELELRLPSDWPLTLDAFANPNHYWPIEWLKRIARYPHDNDTCPLCLACGAIRIQHFGSTYCCRCETAFSDRDSRHNTASNL